MGWEPLDSDVLYKLKKYTRHVVLFSHTSYWDFYILLLYMITYPKELKHVRILIKPQPFQYFGRLLRYFGAIPSTKVEEKKGGAVDRITQELNKNREFLFLISPKGTIMKKEWRSGYFHIARDLGANIAVAGLDYQSKCVFLSDEFLPESSSVNLTAQNYMSKIVPLYPERETISVDYNPLTISVIDRRLMIIYTIPILLILCDYLFTSTLSSSSTTTLSFLNCSKYLNSTMHFNPLVL